MGTPVRRQPRRGEAGTTRLWRGLAVFAVAAVLGNEVGSLLRYPDIGAAVLFPPYAILTAALVGSARRDWTWYIAIGSLAHLATHWPEWPLSWVLLADVANVTRALVATLLLNRLLGSPPRLASLPAVMCFFFSAVVIAPAVGAAIGAWDVVLHGASGTYWAPLRAWFVSNALTGLTMLPAALAAFPFVTGASTVQWRRGVVTEALLLCLALLATCELAFLGGLARQHVALPLYGSLPVLIWSAVRFGPGAASATLTGVTFAAIWSVDRGIGPFLSDTPDSNILALQLFIACTGAPVLCLAALAGARENALQLYGALLSSLQDHVAVLDARGTVLEANPSWRRAAAADSSRLHRVQPGDSFLDICTASAAEGDAAATDLAEGVSRVLKGNGQRFEIEYDQRQQGFVETFAASVERLERAEGGAVVIRRNVTARRQAETEIQAQREQLSHLARVSAIGHLSGALAHELQQPLTAIGINSDVALALVRRHQGDLAPIGAILRDVIADNQRASAVIERLRGLLRRGEVRFQEVEVAEVIVGVLTLARAELVARNIETETRLGPSLPLVWGDRVQLQQVVLNLVLNASEAMGSGGRTTSRRLVVSAESDGDRGVHLRVRDHGTGIPAELLPRLFQPFVTTKDNGLGLGLSISNTIIGAHGGRLWAENNADGGATLHCFLPAMSHHPTSSTGRDDAISPVAVAIVDDDASVRVSLVRVCSIAGLKATPYSSGPELLDALSGGAAFDCLLLDAHMPEMTGDQIQRHLVASNYRVPTIAITGDPSLHGWPDGTVPPMAWLHKPIASDTLLATIRRVVGEQRPEPGSDPAPVQA